MADVERGPISCEVDLMPDLPARAPTPSVTPPAPAKWSVQQADTPAAAGRHASAASVSGHGAFVQAQPNGTVNRPPAYPWLARVQGWEGRVLLGVRVRPDGRGSHVEVAESSGHGVLDDAARRAIEAWQFIPAKRFDHPVSTELELPVRFRLTAEHGETS